MAAQKATVGFNKGEHRVIEKPGAKANPTPSPEVCFGCRGRPELRAAARSQGFRAGLGGNTHRAQS